MKIQFKNNWDETLQRFDAWFHNKEHDRPLMNLWIKRKENNKINAPMMTEEPFADDGDMYLNVEKNFARRFNQYCRDIEPVAEAFPQFSMDLGAGSMALYLGSEPVFTPETIWFTPIVEDYNKGLRYDADSKWWNKHCDILRRQIELTKDTDIACCIPDIIENIDILSAMRDPQTCCFDLYDEPEGVMKTLNEIKELYPIFYNTMYDIVKRSDGSSAYTAFNIIGSGKTAKIQCDFAALMSPEHFDEFIIPSLEDQCSWIDNTIFHLDGPECFPQVDSLMAIEKLGGLQWTPGARNPRAGDESWYPLYKKVRDADKALWLSLMDYTPEESIEVTKEIVRKFGYRGMFFNYPVMNENQAHLLMEQFKK